MIKKLLIALLLLPNLAFAQTTLSSGGTGWGTSSIGDLLIGTSSTLRYTRLPIGSTGQVLWVLGGRPAWVATSSLGITGIGGSGNTAWTIGSGLIYNATTTDFVGVGTTTPTSLLTVASSTATGATTIVSVATSTSLFSILGNGNTGIGVAAPTTKLQVNGGISLLSGSNFDLNSSSLGSMMIKRNGGANGMEFFTNSVSRLFISDTGNIGIATTTPLTKLVVQETNASAILTLTNSRFAQILGGEIGRLSFFSQDGSTNGAGEKSYISSVENDGGLGRSYDLTFGTGLLSATTEKMRIDKNGNVGIGTTTPTSLLYVAGTGDADIILDGASGNNRAFQLMTNGLTRWSLNNNSSAESGSNAGSNFTISRYSDAGTLLDSPLFIRRSTSGGTVGIFTAGPDRALDVLDASNPQLRLTSTDNTTFTDLQTNSLGDFYINPSSGLVGIGTSTPSQTLHVQGGLRLTGQLNDSINNTGSTGQVLISTGTSTLWGTVSGSLSGGENGFIPRWLSGTTQGTSTILDNGIVSGVNATSSLYVFTIQSSTSTPLDILNIASSTGKSMFEFGANGGFNLGTTTNSGYSSSNPSTIFIDNTGNPSSEGLTELSDLNGFFETNTINVSSGANAQSCKSVTNNLGSLTSSFGALCINSSGFNNPQLYNVGGANDVSLMALSGGSLIINNASTTGSIDFITGGVSTTTLTRMKITNNGNIGIGSSTPSSTLDIRGTSTTPIINIASSTGASLFRIANNGIINMATTTVTGSSTFTGTVRMNSTLQIGGALSGVTTAALSSTLTQTMTALATSTLATIRGYYAVNSTAATITQNQQSPAIELEGKVWQGSSQPANWRIQTTFPATSTSFATSSLDFTASLNNTATTTVLSLKSSGRIGIGTTTPGSRVSIVGTSTDQSSLLIVSSSTGNPLFTVGSTGSIGFNNQTGTAGQVLQSFGSSAPPQWVSTSSLGISGGGGSGITSLNGLTGVTQTFTARASTTATSFFITSAGTDHTFDIPDAGASARGFISTTTQTFGGIKTFGSGFSNNASGFRAGTFETTATTLSSAGTQLMSNTAAGVLLRNSAQTTFRTITNPSDTTLVANFAHADFLFGNTGTITEAASGNHTLISRLAVKPLFVTAAAATASSTATIYIEGAATTTTVSGTNYSLWVDNIGGGGKSLIDGDIYLSSTSTSGNVGIGTTSPLTKLDVNGTITQATVKSCSLGLTTDASGSITGCVVSDRSLKKNIKSFTKSIETLMKLRAVTYKWKDTNKDTQVHSGFIAQEVAKVLPEAVVSAGENIKGVDPNAVLSLVVKSLQDLVVKVSGLEEKLNEQQEEIDELRAILIKNKIK